MSQADVAYFSEALQQTEIDLARIIQPSQHGAEK